MNEPLAHGVLFAIFGMAGATLLARMSGYWLMGRIPMTRRVQRGLEILPGAIMAAIVIPIVAKAGIVAFAAIAVAIISMVIRRNEFIAVGLALATATALRAYGL